MTIEQIRKQNPTHYFEFDDDPVFLTNIDNILKIGKVVNYRDAITRIIYRVQTKPIQISQEILDFIDDLDNEDSFTNLSVLKIKI